MVIFFFHLKICDQSHAAAPGLPPLGGFPAASARLEPGHHIEMDPITVAGEQSIDWILSQDFDGDVAVRFQGDGLEGTAVSVVAKVMPLPVLVPGSCLAQKDPSAGIQGGPGDKCKAG